MHWDGPEYLAYSRATENSLHFSLFVPRAWQFLHTFVAFNFFHQKIGQKFEVRPRFINVVSISMDITCTLGISCKSVNL